MGDGLNVVRVGVFDAEGPCAGRPQGGGERQGGPRSDGASMWGRPDACDGCPAARAILNLINDPQVTGVARAHCCELDPVVLARVDELAAAVESRGAEVLFVVLGSRGADGVEVVRRVVGVGRGVQVVYVDVAGRNATRVYETAHVYLLGWPLVPGDFSRAVDRALTLRERLRERPLVLRSEGVERLVAPGSISFIESDRRLLRVHAGAAVLETYGTMADASSQLPSRFVCPHRSFLVNLSCVCEVAGDDLALKTGERIPLSRRRRDSVCEAFSAYVGRRL